MIEKTTVMYKLKYESNLENIASNFWDPQTHWANNYLAYKELRSNYTNRYRITYSSNTTHIIKTIQSGYPDLNTSKVYNENPLVLQANQERKEYNILNNIQLDQS